VHLPDDKLDYTLAGILKSILISRGARKEKYSTKPPEINIIYPPLSPEESNIILDLADSTESIKRYNELNSEEGEQLIKDVYYKLQRQEHIKEIKRAVRAGLIWHPLVYEFIYTHKGLGNKEILRQIKRGLEKGVKRCLNYDDIQFKNYLDRIEEYRNTGNTWKEIRRKLMKIKIIGNISWQALREKVAKFAPHILPDTDFVITDDMQHLITEDIGNRMKVLWRELYASGKKSQYRQEVKKLFNKQGGD
jgi:hypothetical protein